jgi:hypothetical protein
MCIMEIHEDSTRSGMIQAIAHNLSTIDRDLDMLLKVALSRKDVELGVFAGRVQERVHAAYADALDEFGISLAEVTMDPEGHIHHTLHEHDENGHHGTERAFLAEMHKATQEAQKDETR